MKRCPDCLSIYEHSYNFCLFDGQLLINDASVDSPTLIINENTTLQTTKNLLKPKITTRSIEIETVSKQAVLNHSIKYPRIQGLRNTYTEDRINNFFKERFVFNNQIKEDNFEEELELNEVRDTSFKVKFIDNNLLSIYSTQYQYFSGSMHPLWRYFTYNIDLTSGYVYRYYDLFKKNSDYITRVPRLINSFLDIDKNFEYENLNGKDFEIDEIHPDIKNRREFSFYLTSKRIVFVDLFVSYAMSACHSKIPYSKIEDLIHPQGPLQRFIG